MTGNAAITLYPCDRGTGIPTGYHSFQANPLGIICCVYCGVKPNPNSTDARK